ncbi:hypothetical protein TL16_g02232 [Triparma laevis f. inornata]|uniref:Uncharacterized protein n=1 Tax=Triparma laevis f. inornata TaxID=1714386 RepID=A0A9W6ZLJ8_9STRA|nr:hypothetical protein TL16_g02232 [Triparma laevis f. inornata]
MVKYVLPQSLGLATKPLPKSRSCRSFPCSLALAFLIFVVVFVFHINTLRLIDMSTFVGHHEKTTQPYRVLYIFHTVDESRLAMKVNPNAMETISSLVGGGENTWEVDVHMIAAYNLTDYKKMMITASFKLAGANVVRIQEDALPELFNKKLKQTHRPPQGLAMQHRFAIRDALNDYDFFVAFEDDIVITRKHVENYIEKSKLLELAVPDTLIIPGFLRVEVVQEVRTDVKAKALSKDFDPTICCGKKGTKSNVMGWEWSLKSFTLIKLPSPVGGIVALLPLLWAGEEHEELIKGGRVMDEENLNGMNTKLFAQQAGIMATREQVKKFDVLCRGSKIGYLPPFSPPVPYTHAVHLEFWSGGFHLFSEKFCKVERAVFFEGEGEFSKHLLYHMSDNKQHRNDLAPRFIRAEAVQEELRQKAIKFK